MIHVTDTIRVRTNPQDYHRPRVIKDTKMCTKCRRTLSLDDFYMRSTEKGTKRSVCKECHILWVKRNKRNKDKQ